MSVPIPLGGAVVLGDAGRAELAWTAPAGPQGSGFQVELIADSVPLPPIETEASAISVEVPRAQDIFWRVARVQDREYAASGWQALGTTARLPIGSVVFSVAAGDTGSARLAEELALSFRPAGLATIIVESDIGDESSVSYFYAEDADLAEQVADFLPGLTMRDAVQDDGATTPGQIAVRLVGGPSAR